VDYCSYCSEGWKEITGLFHCERLASLLITKFFAVNAMSADDLIKFLKSEKANYYAEGNVPTRHMGKIHGLAIALLCKGSIIPTVDAKHSSLIGTEDLKNSHISFKGGLREVNGVMVPVVNTDEAWESLNCI
jgi:hypothetical protein